MVLLDTNANAIVDRNQFTASQDSPVQFDGDGSVDGGIGFEDVPGLKSGNLTQSVSRLADAEFQGDFDFLNGFLHVDVDSNVGFPCLFVVTDFTVVFGVEFARLRFDVIRFCNGVGRVFRFEIGWSLFGNVLSLGRRFHVCVQVPVPIDFVFRHLEPGS